MLVPGWPHSNCHGRPCILRALRHIFPVNGIALALIYCDLSRHWVEKVVGIHVPLSLTDPAIRTRGVYPPILPLMGVSEFLLGTFNKDRIKPCIHYPVSIFLQEDGEASTSLLISLGWNPGALCETDSWDCFVCLCVRVVLYIYYSAF